MPSRAARVLLACIVTAAVGFTAPVQARQKEKMAAARKTAAYRTEQATVKKRDARGAAPPASSPIEQQCQALWAEAQGTAKKKP